jgi:hypothetical protein
MFFGSSVGCLALGLGALTLAEGHLQAAAVPQRARYLVLTAQHDKPPDFKSVDIIIGPQDDADRNHKGRWWQIEARAGVDQSEVPLFELRVQTDRSPFERGRGDIKFRRYQLHLPDSGETLEYRDEHTQQALLPGWSDFQRDFVPHAAASSPLQGGIPQTVEFLGQVLTLTGTGPAEWPAWPEVKVLPLDRECLVGTSRNFKDAEGHRLPQTPERQDYTYVRFKQDDYRTMIDAGINLFTLDPAQEAWVRDEPVFYVRHPMAKPFLRFPADLLRANYLGPVMFMDEPSILMVGDTNIHDTLRYFSDAAALIAKRTRATYEGEGSYGSWALDRALRQLGFNLGDMKIQQWDFPSWETYYDTAHYQFAGGAVGFVHEGRYQLDEFDRQVAAYTGADRRYTPDELLRYHYALMRGAARRFGGNWGTAIYGQADPAFSDRALTLAYDLGARYLWFWTSDHDHHVPWPEQLELARKVRDHKQAHPRPSIYGKPPRLDTLILIPNGYFISLRDLWWVREMDKERKNDSSRRYRRLVKNVFNEVHRCFDRHEDFDIDVDDGRPVSGYRRVIKINLE